MTFRRVGPLKTPLIYIHLKELKPQLFLAKNSNQGQDMEEPKDIALLTQR